MRRKILAYVAPMVLLSLLSSTVSLYRMTEVNELLEAINHVSVPIGRLFTQMQSDADVFHREFERNLGYSHWKDSHWRPRPAPHWIENVLQNEISRVQELIKSPEDWTSPGSRGYWQEWAVQVKEKLLSLSEQSAKLYQALEQKDMLNAGEIYTRWTIGVTEWKRQLQWAALEYERSLRQNFATTERRVSELRTGLEIVLIVVVLMSLLLLWLGERALRPLEELTRLAREITRRGLRKEDKSLLPEIPLSRTDEVSQLAREFHHMATALLEREKTVQAQKHRLQEQNRLLRDMGELNQNILNSIDSVLIVTDLDGKVTQCNPGALRWLGGDESRVMGSHLMEWPRLQLLFEQGPSNGSGWLEQFKRTGETWRLGPIVIEDRIHGGYVMPLKQEQGEAHGAIIVLDDLTEEVSMEERLRQAENLAAVGRMSAQVAHEVRNPLHSIGLEAEMAIDLASKLGNSGLKLSLQSILNSVDRLQKITENYLKLSRLSTGQKEVIELSDILNSVLETYGPVSQEQGVTVQNTREPGSSLKIWGDSDLFEQVLGNLFHNALQALENGCAEPLSKPKIQCSFGNTEAGQLWFRIEDNGFGILPHVKDKLFTPFVSTRAQGTGLGLSFVKKVLEDHGGTVRIIENPDKIGACFEVILPLIGQDYGGAKVEGIEYGENLTR